MDEEPRNFSPVPRASPEAEEQAAFSARLIFSLFLASLAFYAADKSLFVLAVAFIGWCLITARLFLRFGRRAVWALPGLPLAFWWLWLIWMASMRAREGGTLV